MAKKGNTEPPRDDPRENNWEIEEKEPALIIPDELKVALENTSDLNKERIIQVWKKVPENIRCGNPVWIYSDHTDIITFIFRDGRKARIHLEP